MAPLGQSDVLALLGRVFDVPADRPTALLGRLQHFKRLGFPSGANTGRGNSIKYDARRLVEILVAFELLSAGQRPEIAISLLAPMSVDLAQNASLVGKEFREHRAAIVSAGARRLRNRYMYFGSPFDFDGAETFGRSDAAFCWEHDLDMFGWSNSTLICLTTILLKASRALSAISGVSHHDFTGELIGLGDTGDVDA